MSAADRIYERFEDTRDMLEKTQHELRVRADVGASKKFAAASVPDLVECAYHLGQAYRLIVEHVDSRMLEAARNEITVARVRLNKAREIATLPLIDWQAFNEQYRYRGGEI